MNLAKVGEYVSTVSLAMLGAGCYIGMGALTYHIATAPEGSVVGAVVVGCFGFGFFGVATAAIIDAFFCSAEQPQQERSYCECNDECYWSDKQ